MSIRKPQPKLAIKLIRSAFDAAVAAARPLSIKDAYDLLANLEGYKNWAHAKDALEVKGNRASKKTKKLGYTADEVKDWPIFVIFMNFGEEDSEEHLYVMPAGSTLQNRAMPRSSWVPFNEDGSILMPTLFEALESDKQRDEERLNSFVVREVFSTIPRIDRYGIPDYANERGVKHWVLADLGWNFLAYANTEGKMLSAIDVNVSDTGDDGSGRYWMEVSVAPDVAAAIFSAFEHAAPADRYKAEAD